MLLDCCLKHIIENSSSICHVYTTIRYTQPQFPIYVYMLIHPQRWSTRRAIIWQEILRFVSLLVREGREVLSLYQSIAITQLCDLFATCTNLDCCLHTFCVSLRIAISPYLRCWSRQNTSRISISLRQYHREIPRISGPRNGICTINDTFNDYVIVSWTTRVR